MKLRILFLCLELAAILVLNGKAARVARIVQGEVVHPHSQPWQVSLQYHNGYHFCGAALVDTRWVLTAAHCVDSHQPADIRAVMGEHRLSQREGPEQFINVSAINLSPFYNLVREGYLYYLPHDLAMLRLATPAKINTFVQTIFLADPGIDYTGRVCTAAGWGATMTEGISDVLLKTDMRVLENFECRLVWTDFIYYGNICVANGESTPCEGDSGGPLVCSEGMTPLLVGVSSWGHPDCGDLPAVYTRITENLGWIREVIAEQA